MDVNDIRSVPGTLIFHARSYEHARGCSGYGCVMAVAAGQNQRPTSARLGVTAMVM